VGLDGHVGRGVCHAWAVLEPSNNPKDRFLPAFGHSLYSPYTPTIPAIFNKDTGQAEALAHLVIQEGLIALVNLALQDLASATGARARAAGVGQLQALLLSLIQDVHVLGAFLGCSLIAQAERPFVSNDFRLSN